VIDAYRTNQETAFEETGVPPDVVHFNYKYRNYGSKYANLAAYIVDSNYKISVNTGCRCVNRPGQCQDLLMTLNGKKRCFTTVYKADHLQYADMQGDHMAAKLVFSAMKRIYPDKEFSIPKDMNVSASQIFCSHPQCDQNDTVKIMEIYNFSSCYRAKYIVTPTNEVFLYSDGTKAFTGDIGSDRYVRKYEKQLGKWEFESLRETEKKIKASDEIERRRELRNSGFIHSVSWISLLVGSIFIGIVVVCIVLYKYCQAKSKYSTYKKLDTLDPDGVDSEDEESPYKTIKEADMIRNLAHTAIDNSEDDTDGFSENEFSDPEDPVYNNDTQNLVDVGHSSA
jgi:hypothetical protein